MEPEKTLLEQFQSTMYRKLKNTVRGFVRYYYISEEDTFKVTILRKDVMFTYYIKNIQEKLYNGYSTDDALNEILKKYRKVLLYKIFLRETKEDNTYVAS